MLKKAKFYKQHFVPELLCRHEINLPPELIGKHVRTRGLFIHELCNIMYDWSV